MRYWRRLDWPYIAIYTGFILLGGIVGVTSNGGPYDDRGAALPFMIAGAVLAGLVLGGERQAKRELGTYRGGER